MISAGQTAPNVNGGAQQPAYPPTINTPQIAVPTAGAPAGNPAPALNINWTPKDDAFMGKYMDNQLGLQYGNFCLQAAGMMNGMIGMCLNYSLASKGIEAQQAIMSKYYDVQSNAINAQMRVGLAQCQVQEKAVDAQRTMHQEQCRHEEKLARLSGSTQVRLKAIEESGKTQRADILSANYAVDSAFSRGSWSMGSPSMAA